MAFVTVRNATVVSSNAKGFTIVESYTRNGEEQKTYYKVWTDEPAPQGSVNISGILSVRVSEYEGKTRAEIHINRPRIEVADVPVNPHDSVASSVYTRPSSAAWGNPAPASIEDAPF
jgi:hypothetical protein